MRRVLLIMAAILLGVAGMHAQDYKYEPLPREGVKWVYYYNKYQKTDSDLIIYKPYYLYEVFFKGDTVMNGGRSYKKLYMKFFGAPEMGNTDWPWAWVRESDKRVYAVINKKHPYTEKDAMMRRGGPKFKSDDYDSTGEMLIYDFNDIPAFYSNHMQRNDTDLVIDGYRRVTYFPVPDPDPMVKSKAAVIVAEGYGAISSTGNFFCPVIEQFMPAPDSHTIGVSHILNDRGEIIYKAERLYNKYITALTAINPDGGGGIEVRVGEVVAKAGGTAATLRLVAMNGAVVAQKRVEACGSASLSTAGLAPGVYAAVLTSPYGSQSRKVAVR